MATKSVQIYIQVDDVQLADLEELQQKLEEAIAVYENKRITMTLQDEALVRPPRR